MSPEDFVALALSESLENERGGYGYSMRVASGNPAPPGCIALTWIAGKDASERERIREHAKKNVADFLEHPGFLSIVTGFIGLRGFTVTAWETEEAMREALSGNHAQAMRELFADDFVASVWTSVWKPTRVNRLWVRCTACASLQDASADPETCTACGAELPPRPAYW
jgi:quinol monooxygenase YgiN